MAYSPFYHVQFKRTVASQKFKIVTMTTVHQDMTVLKVIYTGQNLKNFCFFNTVSSNRWKQIPGTVNPNLCTQVQNGTNLPFNQQNIKFCPSILCTRA